MESDGFQKIINNDQYNIGHICTKRQCELGNSEKIAMRYISPNMKYIDYSFEDMENHSNKFANVCQSLSLVRGDVISTLLPKIPEQFFILFGSLKLQLIICPLFSNFGEEAIVDRIGNACTKVLVTQKSFLKKLDKIEKQLPNLKYVILVDIEKHLSSSILSYPLLMQAAAELFEVPITKSDTPSVLHYTSGSTGKPKGVLHLSKGIVSIHQTTRDVLGLREDDIFWCTADQGWVTGTSYGMIGPWSCGVTQIHFGGKYNPESWLSILEKEKVTIWYTAPTALRMLMREDISFFRKFNLQRLRYIFSIGEPLNPEVIKWASEVLRKDVYDTWFQTETGAIMIANRPGIDIKPGSMGKPVEGVQAAIVNDAGKFTKCNELGTLCLKSGWPSMYSAYLNDNMAFEEKFKNGYYYSGDLAFKDDEGYYWFFGRRDDVINTAGHLVGPFEIESALLEVDEIEEAAVVGAPDELLFEKIIAFITLRKDITYNVDIELKIRILIAAKVSTIAIPKDIIVVDKIPKTKSGKILRRLLKRQYLREDIGDVSTVEEF